MKIEQGINPNCSELILRLEDLSLEKVVPKLQAIGIKIVKPSSTEVLDSDCFSLVDVKAPGGIDLGLQLGENEREWWVATGDYNDRSFHSLARIAKALDVEVEPFDGGHIDSYDEWLSAGGHQVLPSKAELKKIRKRLKTRPDGGKLVLNMLRESKSLKKGMEKGALVKLITSNQRVFKIVGISKHEGLYKARLVVPESTDEEEYYAETFVGCLKVLTGRAKANAVARWVASKL